MPNSRSFLTWLKKVMHIGEFVQAVSDSRIPGQVTYHTPKMALLTLLYCLAMPRSNQNFFEVYVDRRALMKVCGFKGKPPSQDTFEYVLRRYNILSIRKLRRLVLRKMKRMKVFGGRVVVAVDATEIPLPNGDYEGCAVRKHDNGRLSYYLKVIVVSLIGPHEVPLILGIAPHDGPNELKPATKLLRQIVREYGKRFIDVLVADRLYVSHELTNELKGKYDIDVIIEAKSNMHVLEEGKALLDAESPEPTWGKLKEDETFRLREVSDVSHAWDGLEVGRLRFIEAYQASPWPDPRGKREKRTRFILTTLEYGTAEWVHRCLRWRWWLENTNWDLKNRFKLETLPSRSAAGIAAYLEFLATAYCLFHCFLARQLGGPEKLGKTLTSCCDIFVRALWALQADDVVPLVIDTS